MAELSTPTIWLARLRERLGRRALHALLGALLALLALGDLTRWHTLEALDNRVGDVMLRWDAGRRAPPRGVVIVDIDQTSLVDPRMLELAGTWSWPRAIHAELLAALAAHDPRAMLLDLILSPPDRLRPENDAALAEAMRDARIFVPMILMEDSAQQAPLALAPEVMGIRAGAHANLGARHGIDAPIALPPELWRTGYINFIKDGDGIGRGTELGRWHEGWWLPHIVGRVADLLNLPRPTTSRFRLHWYGSEFTRVPYAQVYLATQTEGQALPFDPRGKIIVIGATASGLLDFVPTPVAATTPGPFVLATALANLENGDWLRDAPTWIGLALALALIALMGWAFVARASPVWPAALFVVTGVAALGSSALLLGANIYWMPVSALAMGLLALLAFGLLSSRLEMAQRHHVQAMFSRFVDPHIVENLSDEQHVARAEVTASREVTVLFSDIRGFTSLSEHRQPEEIVALLNRYFEMQVEVIFRHGGTLDKFIGDAIMAFWGAPMEQHDHALRAARAALEMSEALERFAAEVAAELPDTRFEIGIGIHSGPAVVGFLGTSRRLDYTAIGDTVNLASRIEGCTKGVSRILVSEATRRLCGDALHFADHGAFSVKGREQQVLLYEPLPTMAPIQRPATGYDAHGGEA